MRRPRPIVVQDRNAQYRHRLSVGDRPRERLLRSGPESLNDVEILAILIQTGTPKQSCEQIAAQLIDRFGSLSAVIAAPLSQVRELGGIGPAKFALIQAAAEAMRRVAKGPKPGEALESPLDLSAWLRVHLSWLPHEVFGAAFLDSQRRLIRTEEIFRGSLSQTSVYPRELVARALQLNAAQVIIFHNHPSGVPKPSGADLRLTQGLRILLSQLDIDLWDHLIVAGEGVVSLTNHLRA
ncbi:MAG: DNA repair protein RadC [Betaproteobacteria bacterium]|nr:DNA repair protein RadC [Betaproteobacteria bacterium]